MFFVCFSQIKCLSKCPYFQKPTPPWKIPGYAPEKSISIKNKLLTKFINKKDPQTKAECHEKYEKYRNPLSSLLKESKHIYYTKYFESNWNNIRNTWKEIKTIIPIKNITTTIPHSINQISNFHPNIIQTTYSVQIQIRSS